MKIDGVQLINNSSVNDAVVEKGTVFPSVNNNDNARLFYLTQAYNGFTAGLYIYSSETTSWTSLQSGNGNSQSTSFNNKILILGSSVAYGTGATSNHGWGYMLTTALSGTYNIVNKAIGGDTTTLCINRFYTDVVPEKPSVVIIALSLANEGLISGNPKTVVEQFLKGIEKLIKMCRAEGYKVIVTGVYPNNDYNATHYKFLKIADESLQNLGVPYIGFLGAVDDGTGKWLPGTFADAGHPNDVGHDLLFNTFDLTLFNKVATYIPNYKQQTRNIISFQSSTAGTIPISYTPNTACKSITVSMRIRRTSVGNVGQSLLAFEGTSSIPVRLRNSVDAYEIADVNGTVINGTVLSSSNLETHIVVVINTKQNLIKFYTNGVLTGSATVGTLSACNMLSFGNRTGFSGNAIGFEYSDIMVWRTCLRDEQVKNLYNGIMPISSQVIYSPILDSTINVDSRLINLAPSDDDLLMGVDAAVININATSTEALTPYIFRGPLDNTTPNTPGVAVGVTNNVHGTIQLNGTSPFIDFAHANIDSNARIVLNTLDKLQLQFADLQVDNNIIVNGGNITIRQDGGAPSLSFVNDSDEGNFDVRLTLNGDNNLSVQGGTLYIGIQPVWHSGNDGPNSGLDADTVDGLHASNFIKKYKWFKSEADSWYKLGKYVTTQTNDVLSMDVTYKIDGGDTFTSHIVFGSSNGVNNRSTGNYTGAFYGSVNVYTSPGSFNEVNLPVAVIQNSLTDYDIYIQISLAQNVNVINTVCEGTGTWTQDITPAGFSTPSSTDMYYNNGEKNTILTNNTTSYLKTSPSSSQNHYGTFISYRFQSDDAVPNSATNPSYRLGTEQLGMYKPTSNTIGFTTNGVNRLSISNTAATFTVAATGPSFTPTSSLRYKHDITTLNIDERFDSLRAVNYVRNESNKPDIGFIAEEVFELYPEIVALNDNNQVEALDYDKITALLVAKVQKQQHLIDQQQTLLQQLNDRLTLLENK